jgi:hypothetical protein
MKNTRLPWVLRGTDFSSPGWHVDATVGYQLMFEFLRLSPSYELARKHEEEELTKTEIVALPNDFDEVLKTFRLLGSVRKVLFRDWWLARGLKVFGNPYTKPKVHEVAHLAGGKDISFINLKSELTDFLTNVRPEEGLASSVLISVPTGLKRAEMKKQLTKLLMDYANVEDQPDKKPVLSLQGKRLRAKVLFNGLRLMWFKAAKPKWEDWRLGAKAEVSKSYARELDVNAPRRTKDSVEAYDREMMTKVTYRALRKFESIAENAARGKFPLEGSVSQSPFDYLEIQKRVKEKGVWERGEKLRLTKLYEQSN